MSTPPSLDTGTVYSVSEVNQLARAALESSLGVCAVVGEISNLARPASGHVYFSLKDTDAQLRCAFFRQRQRGLDFRPENGDEVIAIGRVSLYEPRGD
ncbi:MAG: exodeoxyribonuclease VII large subunit, partial [Pseudomonadota bacterium]